MFERGYYYKLCHKQGKNKYISALFMPNEAPFCLRYKIDEITYAPLGTIGILLFKNISDARKFKAHFYDRLLRIIIKGKAIKPAEPKTLITAPYAIDIFAWMKGVDEKCNIGRGKSAPIGTYVCPGFLSKEVVV